MTLDKALEKVIIEYLGKCKEYGCDSCFAQCYCIEHDLRSSRNPQDYCIDNIKKYLKENNNE